MWLLYTLISALFFGIGQVVVKKGLSNLPSLFNNIFSSAIFIAFLIPFTLYNGVHFENIASILPLTIVVALLFLCYYYIIGIGQVAFTGTIIGTSPLITVLLSLIFLREDPSIFQKLAIFLIIFGNAFIALPENKDERKAFKLGRWFWLALCAATFIGLADFLVKSLLIQSDIYTYLFTYSICSMIIALLSGIFDKKGRAWPSFNWKVYGPTLIGVTIMQVGFFSFHLALSQGLASLVSPISCLYVGITAVLAWAILKEKITKVHFVGIALSALGVILIGIS